MSKRSNMAAHVVKWLQKGKVNRWLVILTFMFIPVFLLLVFTYIPFVKMMGFSFFDMKYIGKREYVGIQNYLDVFQRDDCFKALRLSLYYIGACFVQMSLALYFASVLSTNIRCGNLFKGFMFFPYLICGIAVGFIFKFFYTRGFVFDTVLSWFGFTQDQLPYWLKDTRINNISIAATSIWRYMGQNMVLFIGAIMSVDSTMYEAAAIDGADEWKKFRYIVFPSIKTVIVLNLILSITGSLSAFEPPYVITNGSFGTATYFVVMNKLAHENQKVGLASAMAVILLVIILAATLFQKLIFRYFFGEGEEDSWREKRLRRKREMISRKEGA
nr:sugar ABC transporter permease [Lacrimispora aerotolerans]